MSNDNKSKLGITDVVLRDGHQSLLATRMRIEDMLPIASKLDQVGFWSLESLLELLLLHVVMVSTVL